MDLMLTFSHPHFSRHHLKKQRSLHNSNDSHFCLLNILQQTFSKKHKRFLLQGQQPFVYPDFSRAPKPPWPTCAFWLQNSALSEDPGTIWAPSVSHRLLLSAAIHQMISSYGGLYSAKTRGSFQPAFLFSLKFPLSTFPCTDPHPAPHYEFLLVQSRFRVKPTLPLLLTSPLHPSLHCSRGPP